MQNRYRPSPSQLRRETWMDLNGKWDFAVQADEKKPEAFDRTILVPYCPESALSGIHNHFPEGSFLFYRRYVRLPEAAAGHRILLHMGAADQALTCYVNGVEIGSHTGGYTAFTMDITRAVREENEILLRVRDDLTDTAFPRGKQSLTPGGMWYTPVSGIWQSVWLEWVPETYIQSLDIRADMTEAVLDTGDASLSGTVTVMAPEENVTLPLTGGRAVFRPETPRLWSPEDPYLYEFEINTGADRVSGYFALRSWDIRNVDGIPRLFVNGKPRFFHGLLDQGYWPDGIYTPPSPDCYRQEILAMKRMGFNTLRKHIKVEPEEFYYQCDKLGMFVFQDMVSNGDYSYLKDTILPTLGFQRKNDRRAHPDKRSRQMFLDNMKAQVLQLKNHPCIAMWTIFNEGWGQFDATAAYHTLKALDDSRFVCSCSGWFRSGESDVFSRHIYFGQWHHLKRTDKPLVLTEFGGICLAVDGHLYNPDKSYGYQSSKDSEDYRKKLLTLYRKHILPAIPKGLCAAIYTQVSDVEEEINGLLTYDRQVTKPDAEEMRCLSDALYTAVRK